MKRSNIDFPEFLIMMAIKIKYIFSPQGPEFLDKNESYSNIVDFPEFLTFRRPEMWTQSSSA
jgi:hypothetical protein